jgi:hypothetical protein
MLKPLLNSQFKKLTQEGPMDIADIGVSQGNYNKFARNFPLSFLQSTKRIAALAGLGIGIIATFLWISALIWLFIKVLRIIF